MNLIKIKSIIINMIFLLLIKVCYEEINLLFIFLVIFNENEIE